MASIHSTSSSGTSPPSPPSEQQELIDNNESVQSFFNADESADGFVAKETAEPLSWRGDPSETLADWRIIVTCSCTDTEQTFHVHRAIIGRGSRKSEYFCTLFQETHFRESEDQCSRIKMETAGALDAFQYMLDFQYGGFSWIIDASKENAVRNTVALRFLAQYFQIRSLMAEINKLVERELDASTCVSYLVEAVAFGDDRLAASSKAACAQLCWKINPDLYAELPPETFKSIVESDELKCEPFHLSFVIARYFDRNPETLTFELLHGLTNNEETVKIGKDAAASFLNHIDAIDTTMDKQAEAELTKLSLRCASSVVQESWIDVNAKELVEAYMTSEKRQFTNALVAMSKLAAALETGQQEMRKTKSAITVLKYDFSAKDRKIAELEARVEEYENRSGRATSLMRMGSSTDR